ncbi:hypothetical protein ACQPZ8_01375 [Actinomadura nitritigenes]|jgi:hypothetical protein|uniref:Major tail protein n=1 Tax=Actinomadura violacea TaxID=2819934 RepID=A0ABS3RUX4_9ACTN|nr:hypothetical protein [Actinomadura violacea]MBO2459819.1 hypothetical protein [Actinomadura violacea]
MGNTENVSAGSKGYAYFADIGTTAPLDIVSPWPAGWGDAGIITDEGLTEALAQEQVTHMGWGIPGPIRREPKDRTTTFKLTLTETTAMALSLYYSVPIKDMDTVGDGDDIGVAFDDPETASTVSIALGMDVIDSQTGRLFRYIVPRAEVSDRDNIQDNADNLHQYGLTFTAMVPVTGGSPVRRMISKVPIPT